MSNLRPGNRKINPMLQLQRVAKKEQQDRAVEVEDFEPVNPNIQKKRGVDINRDQARPNPQRTPRSTAAPESVERTPAHAARPTPATEERPRQRRVNPAFITDEAELPSRGARQTRDAAPRPTQRRAVAANVVVEPDEIVDLPAESIDVEGIAIPAEERVQEKKPQRRMNPRFVVDEEEAAAPQPQTQARASFPRASAGGFQRPTKVTNRNFVPKYRRKAEAPISAEDWSEDESQDPEYGLGARRDTGRRKPKYEKAVRLSNRDIIVIKFLARYRYAWRTQLAYLLDTTPESISQRLRKLEASGFIRKQHLTDRQYLWMSTKAGNILVNSPFPEIKKGSLSPATIQHTIGIGSLAIELEREAGGKDILGERKDDPDAEPAKNRYKLGIWGHEEGKGYGEMTVSEREIRQGQLRWRGGRSTLEMRELVDLAIAAPPGMEAQELLEGNEGLFVVYGANGQDGEHIPDLVVAKERGPQNEVRHIAIELELTGKPFAEWKRILRWYRDNGVMYDKIYYFTHNRAIATALRRVDEEVGLGDRLVIRKYNPRDPNMPFWG